MTSSVSCLDIRVAFETLSISSGLFIRDMSVISFAMYFIIYGSMFQQYMLIYEEKIFDFLYVLCYATVSFFERKFVMAKRTFGAAAEPALSDATPVQTPVIPSADNTSEVYSDKRVPLFGIIFIVLCVLGLVLGIIYYRVVVLDTGHGLKSAESAATAFFTAANDDSSLSVFDYVPRQLRTSGCMVDDVSFFMMRRLKETSGSTVSSVQPFSFEDVDAESVALQVSELYGQQFKIDAAKKLSVNVNLSSDVLTTGVGLTTYTIDVMTVKYHNKWYVLPGVLYQEGVFL